MFQFQTKYFPTFQQKKNLKIKVYKRRRGKKINKFFYKLPNKELMYEKIIEILNVNKTIYS